MQNNNQKRREKITIALALLIGLSIVYSPLAQMWNAAAAGTIGGRVFQDFNGNGTYDTTLAVTNDGAGTIGAAVDRGVQNVTVTAYSSTGASVGSATTDASGNYTLTTSDVGSGPYRVEFTNLPSGYYASARSTDSVGGGTATNSGSTVQFASAVATNVNLAVNYPADYSQNNPEVVASLYQSGEQMTGGNNGLPVLVSFPYSAGSTDTATTATETLFDAPTANPLEIAAHDIGTTYGLAYARKTRLVYAGAFFKRHAGFGPGGANKIYVISRLNFGSVTTSFTVGNAATNSHNNADYAHDNGNTGWDAVGKTSLGGMAMSEDETKLYVMNLENRTLYSLNPTTGTQIASAAAPTNLPLASGTCAAGDARPFAVTVYHGQLYVGLVCSAESSATVDTFTDSNTNGRWDAGDYFVDNNSDNVRQTTESYFDLDGNGAFTAAEAFVDNDGNGIYNLGDSRKLFAYVYTADPTTLAFSASPVFSTALNYRRGITTHTAGALGNWQPWSNVYRNVSSGALRTVYAQPMLTDIAFDNGNLILGLRDRISDQVGNGALSNPNDLVATNFYQPRTSGDILRACGVQNSWTIESNGRCNSAGGAPQNTNEGVGRGEFYFGDAYDLAGDLVSPNITITGKGGNHDETGSGGIEQLPGAPDVMMTNFDPIPNIVNMTHDGGIRWLSNSTGAFTKAFRLYNGNGNDSNVFGKAGGIGGNLTILPDPAPVELGNRVWTDTDGDGVQDAGENGIQNVTARLYRPGFGLDGIAGNSDDNQPLATAVTDANGEYYFTNGTAVDGNTGDNIGIINGKILYTTAYEIRFDLAANFTTGGALNNLLLTTKDQTSQAGFDDGSDSDASLVSNPTGSPAGTYPVITLTTGNVGDNNHNYDAGFTSSANYSIGNRVWFDTDNDGQIDASEVGASGIQVKIYNATDTTFAAPLATQTTDASGYYRFDSRAAGNYVVRVEPSNFANAAALGGRQNTTGSGSADVDSTVALGGEDGINPTGAANSVQSSGIVSATYTLGAPGEPTNETDVQGTGQGAMDAAANMTVDYGFYRLNLSGTVWNDTGAGANNNNGILNAGENGVLSRVQLYSSTNSEILVGADGILGTSDDAAGGMLTDNSGTYNFQGLPAGQYRVVVTSSSTSSTPTSTTPDNNIDSDDNGFPDNTGNFAGKFISGLVTLTPGSVGAASNNTVTNATGTTSNPTVDFGFVLAPTAVRLEKFDAFTDGKSVELRWSTGEESNNLGFNIYRESNGERKLLNRAPIAGGALRTTVQLAASGGEYVWTDAEFAPDAVYYLEDIDLNGGANLNGSIAPQFKSSLEYQPNAKLISDLAAVENPSGESEIVGTSNRETGGVLTSDRKSAMFTARQKQIAAQGGAKIAVNHDGWYSVSAEELRTAGFDFNSDRNRWQLFADGAEVPFKLNADDSIEFFGRALDNALTDRQVYYLVNGQTNGLRLGQSNGGAAGEQADARSYAVTAERKDRAIYSSAILNGDADNWFGAVVSQTNQTVQDLTVRNLDASAPAHLEIKLQGATAIGHTVNLRFNETELGAVGFDGFENKSFEFDLPASAMRKGANQIRLQSAGGASDVSFVDSIRLTYRRGYTASANQIRFTVPANQTVRVGGFDDQKISVYEINNGTARSETIAGEENVDGTFGFSLAAANYEREFLALANSIIERAATVERNQPSSWNSSTNRADFVIITANDLRQQAEALAAMREAQGLKTRVALVEDLFDEFSFGAYDPQAVKDFLRTATGTWQTKPRYVLLFGDASYDTRNRLNLNQTRDRVPTKLVDTEFMETSSDAWLADFDADGAEDVALGRLPVATETEAQAAIEKLARYDNQSARTEKADVLIADRTFETYSADLQSILPNYATAVRVDRSDDATDAETHARIVERLNANPLVVTYTGHGSTNVWAGSNVFRAGDAADLTNNQLSFYLLMTCLNGYTHNAAGDSLAESLFKSGNGAIAVWSSSGTTHSEKQFAVSSQFTRIVFNAAGKPLRIGDVVKTAKRFTDDADVRRTWQLVGDPTVLVK